MVAGNSHPQATVAAGLSAETSILARSRTKGLLLGSIIGDAVGGPIEFQTGWDRDVHRFHKNYLLSKKTLKLTRIVNSCQWGCNAMLASS